MNATDPTAPPSPRPTPPSDGIVHLDGEFLPKSEARISVDDRGFVFADGVYEVTPVYRGRLFRFADHLARLRRGLAALRIDFDPMELEALHQSLVERNGLESEPLAIVYLQITRGTAPRSHPFPSPPVAPTVYAFARRYLRPSEERWSEGFTAITTPDIRWSRCDLKTVGLLPAVLAQQKALDAGADEAIFVKDGMVLEGAHANAFTVFGDRVVTHPGTHQILAGVTRKAVLESARRAGIPTEERAVTLDEVRDSATELFVTGTTTEVRPCVRLDDTVLGDGVPGPVTRAIREAFHRLVEDETGVRVRHAAAGD